MDQTEKTKFIQKKMNSKLNTHQLIKDRSILIKLFKVEAETVSKHGFKSVAFEAGYTDGGKPEAKKSKVQYQSRGEVIQMTPSATKYFEEIDNGYVPKEGDILLIEPGAVSGRKEYIIEREKPVAGNKGYVLIHAAEVQSVEHQK
jgi:hypothetical protein